ncbi:MAG: hypothetical protein GC190_07405 [Alphaproteobacteria bacterium]|nr:hypothetical protein [Alphaproteobacteria bacterium]
MSRVTALIVAVGVGAAAWIVLPIMKPELSAAWLVGADGLSGIALHGYEIMSIVAGLVVWILGLHFPDRPKPIIFRHSGAAA